MSMIFFCIEFYNDCWKQNEKKTIYALKFRAGFFSLSVTHQQQKYISILMINKKRIRRIPKKWEKLFFFEQNNGAVQKNYINLRII